MLLTRELYLTLSSLKVTMVRIEVQSDLDELSSLAPNMGPEVSRVSAGV